MTTPEQPESLDVAAAAKARAAELVGQTISNRYRIVELVAMGGMGAVYRGEHLRMRKRVAIKVLHPDIEGLPDLVARFEREAVAGAQLQHVNAAAATDFGELDDGSTFLVLEYVAGQTLHDAIKQGGAMPPERAVHIAKQLAAALGAAHAAGIVHRDVKPRNIMLVEGTEDLVKLIDFGLAKIAVEKLATQASDERGRRAVSNLTGEGILLGTVAYLAPEAALGMNAVDARSDLYALGLVLYEMLAGKHPFDAKEPGKLFKQQRFDLPPPMAVRAPEAKVPEKLEAIALKLLSKSPVERYPSGADVVAALDAAVAAGRASKSREPGGKKKKEKSPVAPASPEPARDAKPRESVRPSSSRLSSADRPSRMSRAGSTPAMSPKARNGMFAIAAIVGSIALVYTLMAPKRAVEPVPHPARSAPTAAAPAVALPTAVVSAIPSAPASAPEPETPPQSVDVQATRTVLLKAAETKDWKSGEEALVALASADPSALHEHGVAQAGKDVAIAVEREGGGRGDAVFRALEKHAEGLDILYSIVETRGGSLAEKRATASFKDAAVLGRGSPALRIAFELRDAPCDKKLDLLDRATAEGDARALVVLETLGRGCFEKSKKLDLAIKALQNRLNRPPEP